MNHRRYRAVGWLAMGGLVALYAAFGSFQAYDYDLPLHLITGEYLLKDPASAGTNLFSFTFPGYEWLNDKWLENVIVHLVDAVAGGAGLVAFRMGLVLALGCLLWRAMAARLRRDDPWSTAVAVALLSLFPFVAYERFVLRPELFSLLGIAALLWIVGRDRRGRWEWLGVAALHALWVNLHGYWFVGPLLLGSFLVGDLIESVTGRLGWPAGSDPGSARNRAWHRGVLLAAAIAGALVSPHPLRLLWNPVVNLLFVFGGEGNIGTIAELRSPFDPNITRNWALPFFQGAAAATGAWMLVRLKRVRPAELLLVGGFFVMAAFSRRNIGMFAVVGAVVSAWWGARRDERVAPASTPRTATAVMAAATAFAIWGTWLVATDRFYASDGTSRRTGFSMSNYTYPRGMADFLMAVRPPGPLFNDFASGSYLAYRLFPDYRVFITGNTFKYPPEFFRRYYIVSLGREEYRRVADEYGLRGFAIMYSSGDMMPLAKTLFNDPEYAPIYFDDNALLFVERTPEMEPFIETHRVDFAALARDRAAEPQPPPASWMHRKPAPRGALNRATFLHRVGMYPMAEVEYRRALQVDPTIDEAREGLGEVLLGQARFRDALAVLAPLREELPDRVHLLRDLAKVHSGLGSEAATAASWDEAERELETALQLIDKARGADPEGDPMRALEADNRFNLGYVRWRRAPDDPSITGIVDREFGAALSVQPDNGALRFRVARIRARQGRTEEALDLLAEALDDGGPALADQARRDPSFAGLRGDPRFRQLVLGG